MDWITLIQELKASGMTQAQIGAAVGGKSQAWVADVLRGRYDDIKWSDGEMLRALHAERCKAEPKTASERRTRKPGRRAKDCDCGGK